MGFYAPSAMMVIIIRATVISVTAKPNSKYNIKTAISIHKR